MKTRHLFTHDVRPGRLYRISEAPDNVMLDLTRRCNLHCAFCYNPVEDRDRGDPPTATVETILRALANWGVREVLYLGGEPTLHADFEPLLELGATLGLSQRIVTNGGRIDRRRARRLAEWDVEVGVSLHGAAPDVHDHLTGSPGAFARALRGLNALITSGTGVFVQYSPTRLDESGLKALAALLHQRYGAAIRFIDVNRLLPYGQGRSNEKDVFLDEDGWWAVLRAVGQLVCAGWKVRVESVPRCWIRHRATTDKLDRETMAAILASLRPCYMGVSQLAFDPQGRMKLCPGGPPVGPSILENDPRDLWREHPLLVERRNLLFLPEACVDYETGHLCKEFYECGGGCRSAAGVTPGAADPLAPRVEGYLDSIGLSSSSRGTTGRLVVHHSPRSLVSSPLRSARQSSQT